jgi:hypothetical protein
VRSVAIPRTNKPGVAGRDFEHRRSFRNTIKSSMGSEGRITRWKRSYGWNPTEVTRVRTWCAYGLFGYNLVKISALAT